MKTAWAPSVTNGNETASTSAGATASTYTLTQADVGTTITVVASYTDGQGTNESVTSAGVGPVANVNDAPTGSVTISGTPAEDQTLTAGNTLADEDGLGTISYQWQRNGVDIAGATGGHLHADPGRCRHHHHRRRQLHRRSRHE